MEEINWEKVPLRVKFFTGAYTYEVDNYLNETIEKFLTEDETKIRVIAGTPAIHVSVNGQLLIALLYKEKWYIV